MPESRAAVASNPGYKGDLDWEDSTVAWMTLRPR